MLSSAPGKKRVQIRTDEVDTSVNCQLRPPAAYQHDEPDAAHARRQSDIMPHKTDRAVFRYPPALHDTCPFSSDDSASIVLGLRLADRLEDGMQPTMDVDHDSESDDSEPTVKLARSRSLPTSQLTAAVSDADSSPDQPSAPRADVFQAHYRHRKEEKPAECERWRDFSDTDPEQTGSYMDQDSMSLLTGPSWTTVDRPTTSAEIETVKLKD